MSDYIIRATAADNQIRAFAATTRDLVEVARAAHGTSPVATAALGRLLTAGAMMGSMMKGEQDVLTLQLKGDGPIGGVTVTADAQARVKGYVNNPDIVLPPSPKGKLDVGRAVGKGDLVIIKDMGLKEPYVGRTQLISGEIAEDITYYYAASEQIPSAVALGVLMNRDNTVRRAGGFILQLMPFAEEAVISALEEKVSQISSITTLLDRDMTPEDILQEVLGDLGVIFTDRIETEFYCNCDKPRVEKALISIGEKDLQEMINDGETIEVNCHFCNKKYAFTVEEMEHLLEKARR